MKTSFNWEFNPEKDNCPDCERARQLRNRGMSGKQWQQWDRGRLVKIWLKLYTAFIIGVYHDTCNS